MTDSTAPTPEPVWVVLCTAPPDRAEHLAEALVKQRVAACVNVLPGVRSFYHWQGKLERDDEQLLVIKTQPRLWSRLKETVRRLHPYEVPELIALPVAAVSGDYLHWLEDTLCSSD